jgi:predicted MPP superfamily phosphohydrolase
MERWIILILIILLLEYYSFIAFNSISKNKLFIGLYLALTAGAIIYILYSFSQFDRALGQNKQTLFTFGLVLIMYIPKIILTLVLFGEDIVRMLTGVYNYFAGNGQGGSFLPSRRRFVGQVAMALASIPFASILYGILEGKYNFKVIRQQVYFPDLPEAFDGFKITQISDIHSGSFEYHEEIEYAINLINEQESDLLLFTGDIVNTHAKEMDPWIETFRGLRDYKYGKYSVLGNHDYGEYVTWPNEAAKLANFKAIKDLHSKIDFKLLLNQNSVIEKDGQRLAIVGVENWGMRFKQAGDINAASKGLTAADFKVLMSHDPSHWEYEVKNHPGNYQLTLSGHTHGMQFGIEIPGVIKWSPVQYIYKQWAGLYEHLGRYVYVNRGFGFHAYPGRVGIWPEITVLELKKGQTVL